MEMSASSDFWVPFTRTMKLYAHDGTPRASFLSQIVTCELLVGGHPRLQLLEPIEECSESEQPVDLDDEGPVLKLGKTRCQRVALLVVDDEQLAAGLILPPEPQVCPE